MRPNLKPATNTTQSLTLYAALYKNIPCVVPLYVSMLGAFSAWHSTPLCAHCVFHRFFCCGARKRPWCNLWVMAGSRRTHVVRVLAAFRSRHTPTHALFEGDEREETLVLLSAAREPQETAVVILVYTTTYTQHIESRGMVTPTAAVQLQVLTVNTFLPLRLFADMSSLLLYRLLLCTAGGRCTEARSK